MIFAFVSLLLFQITSSQEDLDDQLNQQVSCNDLEYPEIPYADNIINESEQWNYEQQNLWSSNHFETCDVTNFPIQSPIDLAVQTQRLSTYNVLMNNIEIEDQKWIIPINRNYKGSVAIHSNISTLQFTNEYGIEKKYNSHHIVFKFPSEHMLNGHRFPGEIQISYLVQEDHCDLDGNNLAYLSIFFEIDQVEDQPFFDNVADKSLLFLENFDFQQNITNSLKSGASSYIQYEGTQTNPPCAKATWIVLTSPKLINQKQFNKLTQFFGTVNREIQSLNRRIFIKGTFYYEKEYKDESSYDSSKAWLVLYMATIITLVVLMIIALIIGMWKLAHMSKYRHIEEQKQETLGARDEGLQGVVD